MAFRPNSILMNRGWTVVPSQSPVLKWLNYNINNKKPSLSFYKFIFNILDQFATIKTIVLSNIFKIPK